MKQEKIKNILLIILLSITPIILMETSERIELEYRNISKALFGCAFFVLGIFFSFTIFTPKEKLKEMIS